MLTDKSPAFNDTWRFLEREVATLHTLAGAASLSPLFSTLFSLGMPGRK